MKKNLKKRIISLALALLMAVSVIPQTASAEEIKNLSTTAASVFDSFTKIETLNDNSILGMDFSYYQQDLKWGKTYHNYQYEEVDVFNYIKSQGVNTVSVRVMVNPENASGDAKYFTLENAAKTIKAANAAGLRTNMILFYSDDYTYANNQSLPVAWNSSGDIESQANAYTSETLDYLKQQGALPSMITIGNEVNYNFLSYSGDNSWRGWQAFGTISQTIKAKAPSVKIGIGLAAPTDPTGIQWYLSQDNLNNKWYGCQYDYVGINLYTWDGFDEAAYTKALISQFEETEKSVGKDNVTCYIQNVNYKRYDAEDNSYTAEKQAQNIYNLLKATTDTGNAGGLIVDQAEFVGSWSSFFDDDNAIISLATFAYAQGNKVDISTTPSVENIYKYGLESGLKDVNVNITKIDGMNDAAIRGVDVSSYQALKDAGVKFYDNAGNEAELMKVLADNGVNYIRLRIWNDPYNEKGEVYGGGVNSVEQDLKIAKEATKYGMKLLLCFHYSDFWADPSIQQLPKEWKKDADDPQKIADDIYEFTADTVRQFEVIGADIGMVQIGNEITGGMCEVVKTNGYKDLWGNSEKSKKLTSYLKAGVSAVRKYAPDALVALHLETPNVSKYKYIMNVCEREDVDYDVLGTSYYPFWNQTVSGLEAVQTLAADYGKLFCILETSWLNTLHDADGTTNQLGEGTANLNVYKVGVQGQVDVLTDTYKTILSQSNGLGAFYWEPAWIPVKAGWANWQYNKEMADKYGTGWASAGAVGYHPDRKLYYNGEPCWGGSGWDNQALFDFNGHPLKSLSFYKDSQSGSQTRTVLIKICDSRGNEIDKSIVVKVKVGETATVTLPSVDGYKPTKATIQVAGTKSGIDTQTVKYQKCLCIKPNTASYTYDGKQKTPSVTVYYGNTVVADAITKSNTSVKLSYASGRTNAGTYKIKATGLGKYTGETAETTFKIAAVNMAKCKITLSKTKMTYTGKVQKPTVTVKSGSRFLKKNTNYTIKYSSNKKIGEAKVTIKGKGHNYTGTAVKTFKIVPESTKILKLTKGSKKITVRWKAQKKLCSGYQIQYSTSKKFTTKTTKSVYVTSYKTTKKTISGLKAKKTYYVRIRTYKTVKGKKYYSFYSKPRAVKI